MTSRNSSPERHQVTKQTVKFLQCHTGMTCAVALVVGFIGSLISLRYFDTPYFWAAILWAGVFVWLSTVVGRSVPKLITIHLAAVAAAVGLAEGYGRLRQGPEVRFDKVYDDPRYWMHDDILGYAPSPNFILPSARRLVGNELIYDVKYSIDANGLRRSHPNGSVPSAAPCVIFFGGSFTFGEGVNDDETMPYRVALRAREPIHVYNFGFPGYGPHQMLSALEHGVVDRVIRNCDSRLVAIYQAISHHVNRAAGLSPWDPHGPRYRLAPDGRIQFTGPLHERHDDCKAVRSVLQQISRQLERSRIWRKMHNYKFAFPDDQLPLFTKIVERAENIVEAMGGVFHVIVWDTNPDGRKVAEALRNENVALHLISRILTDYEHHPERYTLHPYDLHPNAFAHGRIAAYVADHILRLAPPSAVHPPNGQARAACHSQVKTAEVFGFEGIGHPMLKVQRDAARGGRGSGLPRSSWPTCRRSAALASTFWA
jgi:hypothetical protein